MISSPFCPGWVAIEALGIETVQELCHEVSTIRQPPHIEFVPLDERVSWLHPSTDVPTVVPTVPFWARVRSATELGGQHPLLPRYAGDLVLVVSTENRLVDLLAVPRLPVKQGPASKRKYKREPRLIVAEGVDFFSTEEDSWHRLPQKMVWHPYKQAEVEWISDSIFRLKRIRIKETFSGPFAAFRRVHTDALILDNIRPTYFELNFFAWGYGVTKQNPAQTFMKQSYERFLRAPLEVGNRVCGDKRGIVGKVVDIGFGVVAVKDESSELVEEFTEEDLRRIFKNGDTVRVHAAVCINHSNKEGWVVDAQENEITVIDSVTKTPVMCQPFQLYDIL